MHQLLSQIQTLQDKVNALNEEKRIFTIWRQRAALECPTFPVNPREFRVPEVCVAAILDCRTIHEIRWVLQEMFFESLPGVAMRHGEAVRREPQSSTIATPRFSRNFDAWNLRVVLEELVLKIARWRLRSMLFRNCFSENAKRQMNFNVGESGSRPKCS